MINEGEKNGLFKNISCYCNRTIKTLSVNIRLLKIMWHLYLKNIITI